MRDQAGTATNRRVHAEVRLIEPVDDRQLVESSFRAAGWGYEATAGDRYLLSIPVYSAHLVAREVARAKVLDFSEQTAQLEILFLRSQKTWTPPRYRYRSQKPATARSQSVARPQAGTDRRLRETSGARPDLRPPPKFGTGPHRAPRPSWEIYSEYPMGDHLLDHLEERFTPHYAGDELRLKRVWSAAENDERATQGSVGRMMSWDGWFFVLTAVIVVSMLVAAAVDLPWKWRSGATAIGGISALSFGWLVRGRSMKIRARVGVGLVSVVFTTLAGFLFYSMYRQYGGYPWVQAVVAVVLIAAVMGMHHLFSVRPRLKQIFNLSTVAVTIGASVAGARILIGGVAGEYGVPYERLALPQWITPLMGVVLFGSGAGIVILVAAGWGWAEYFGVSASFRTSPFVVSMGVGLFLTMFLMMMLVVILGSGTRYYSSWLAEFEEGRTPDMTSDFMYRACVIPVEDAEVVPSYPNVLPSSTPVVVIESKEGPGWAWDPERSRDVNPIQTTPIDTDIYEVRRIADGVESCS